MTYPSLLASLQCFIVISTGHAFAYASFCKNSSRFPPTAIYRETLSIDRQLSVALKVGVDLYPTAGKGRHNHLKIHEEDRRPEQRIPMERGLCGVPSSPWATLHATWQRPFLPQEKVRLKDSMTDATDKAV